MNYKKCFTLAEVLIALAVVGIVAAMTIPGLITKINNSVKEKQISVFNSKLTKGVNLTKVAGELNDTYTSTYDFLVKALSKHLKMVTICDDEHITDCFPYKEIKYEKGKNNREETMLVKDINKASKLKLSGGFKDVAAFVLADGTPVLVSYDLNCVSEQDVADKEVNGCLAGIYDINGNRRPNKFGMNIVDGKTVYSADLLSFNGAALGDCIGFIKGLCIASPVMTNWNKVYSAIKEVDPDYTPEISTSWGHWHYPKVANDYCTKALTDSHLITKEEFSKIASTLYETDIPTGKAITFLTDSDADVKAREAFQRNKTAFFSALGTTYTGIICLLTDTSGSCSCFEPDRSRRNHTNGAHDDGPKALCIGD